jgi:hypothetical protein
MKNWRRVGGALVVGAALAGWAVPATAATVTCTVTDPSANPSASASASRSGNTTVVSASADPGANVTRPACHG